MKKTLTRKVISTGLILGTSLYLGIAITPSNAYSWGITGSTTSENQQNPNWQNRGRHYTKEERNNIEDKAINKLPSPHKEAIQGAKKILPWASKRQRENGGVSGTTGRGWRK